MSSSETLTVIPSIHEVVRDLIRYALIPLFSVPALTTVIALTLFRKINLFQALTISLLYILGIYIGYQIGMSTFNHLGGNDLVYQQFCGILPDIKADMCNETFVKYISPLVNAVCVALECPNCRQISILC
jgi:hypothetical protein